MHTNYCYLIPCNRSSGEENYENQKEFGARVFQEIQDMAEEGVDINDIHHDILLACTCDWKGSACIEGEHNIIHCKSILFY